MTTGISGKGATIDGACNDLVNWSFQSTTNLVDVTTSCSGGFMEFLEGLKTATGTIETTTRYTGTSSITLSNSEGGVSISGDVIWSSEGIDNSIAENQKYTQEFTMTGTYTIS